MERTNEEIIKLIEMALKQGKKLDKETAWKLMREATEKGESLTMVWKIPNKNYQNWYNENKQYLNTTLEEETIYLVHSGAKAFNSKCGGYSIFARSLGMYKRNEEMTIDRIEHSGLEFAIIIENY